MSRSQLFEKIFGSEFCTYIEQVGDTYSNTCWDIANIVCDAKTILADLKSGIVTDDAAYRWLTEDQKNMVLAYSTMDLYTQIALRLGISTRTLRDYYAVGSFYSQDAVDRYSVLPFSHFRFAKQCGETIAESVLELSLKAMDHNGGRPPSVNWLEANLWQTAGDNDVLDEVGASLDFVAASDGIVHSDLGENNEKLPTAVYLFVSRAREVGVRLQDRLYKLDLDGEIADQVYEMINLLVWIADDLLAVQDET